MDRLESIKAFLAVAESGGFARAARKLGISASAATRAVAALEERVGAQLVSRTTRMVRLTAAGERFAAESRRALEALELAESSAALAHQDLRGPLTVTASRMFGQLHVTPILLEFAALHPHVELRAVLSDRVLDLLENTIDVAVRIAELPPDATLHAKRVGTVRRVTCAAPAYLAKHGVPTKPADLAAHSAIKFGQRATPMPWLFVKDGARERVEPRALLVANSTELTVAAAIAGHGVVRALSYQVARELQRGALTLLLEEYEPPALPIYVVQREGPRAPLRARVFAKLAVERLRAEPALAS
ncbi:MAG: LysR substrate-binding domain-containing protein [Polyangiaceae bacterium]